MTDFVSPEHRSEIMRRVRSTNTGPERALLKALAALGLAPGGAQPNLPGKPDIVFPEARLACFVDGELWHGVQWRRRGLRYVEEQFCRSSQPAYWTAKIHRNCERDFQNTSALLRTGWSVLRLWANDVQADPERAARLVRDAITGSAAASRYSCVAAATAADFFAGIGLMSLGLARAGWKTVWANDFDLGKRRFFRRNFPDRELEVDDRPIQRVGVAAVPRVGLAVACFPCTDISFAGAGRGIEDGLQSSAYLRFAEVLSKLKGRRPPFVLLENVPALVRNRGGADFRICLDRLADAGYCVDAVQVDAKHFVPQSRPRLFVVGVRSDVAKAVPASEEALRTVDHVRPQSLVDFIATNPDLPWAVRHLPPPPTRTKQLADMLEEFDPGDPVWWSAERVERLKAQVSERHHDTARSLLARGEPVWATAFRRMRNGRSMAELRFDGVAGCLRTPKGGSAKQMVVRISNHGWSVRLLTPRECARLMGAPDYKLDIDGTRPDDALFGFGDAVAVPVVEWLVRHYVNPIAAELIRGQLLRLPV